LYWVLVLAAAFYVFYYTRFFADAEGLTFVFTLAYLVITFGAIPITYRLVYYDEVIAKRLSGMMMGMWF
jgi:POT family proton-dependent oligopeptide transporter